MPTGIKRISQDRLEVAIVQRAKGKSWLNVSKRETIEGLGKLDKFTIWCTFVRAHPQHIAVPCTENTTERQNQST